MPLTYQVASLNMEWWCLECHRNPEKFIRPKKESVHNGVAAPHSGGKAVTSSGIRIVEGPKLANEYKIQSTGSADELQHLPPLEDRGSRIEDRGSKIEDRR